MNKVKNIAVIGAGHMGCGIAQACAQGGYNVMVMDIDDRILQRAFSVCESNLGFLVQNGMISPKEAQSALSAITGTTNMETAVKNADLVIESVPEVLDLKKEIFSQLDNLCAKHAILTTNTATLPISDIADATTRPDKILGFHWVSPAYLIPLVEIISGPKTSASALAVVKGVAVKLGKTPAVCKDTPGFILNRLQVALLGEAISLLEQGTTSAEDIDNAVRLSLGLRYPFWGPLRTNDLVSKKTSTLAAFECLYKLTGNEKYRPPDLLRQKVKQGELGIVSGKGWYDYAGESLGTLTQERDRNLIKMIRFMRAEA